jgi:hypothetical protein
MDQIRSPFEMATRSVTVGIFDNTQDAERAVERLAISGFEDTVYEDATQEVAGAAQIGPVPVGAVLAPGVASTEASDRIEPDELNPGTAFRSRLAEYQLPHQVVEGYATTFDHGGKFLLVRTQPQRDEEVVRILRKFGASRVNRYDV